MAGQISILDTAITSYDESKGGGDERLEGRAYIAALSLEDETSGTAWISRMDVEDSDISYLGNEGDYHNDISECPRRYRSSAVKFGARGAGGSERLRRVWGLSVRVGRDCCVMVAPLLYISVDEVCVSRALWYLPQMVPFLSFRR